MHCNKAKSTALRAQRNLKTDNAISITAVTGPSSDGSDKRIRLIYIAVAIPTNVFVNQQNFHETRSEIQKKKSLFGTHDLRSILIYYLMKFKCIDYFKYVDIAY